MSVRVKQALVIFTKIPAPGKSKTRLLTVLSPTQAAELQASFLRDTVEKCLTLSDAEVLIAYTPANASAELRTLIPGGVKVTPQGRGDLGVRMHKVLSSLFKQGYHSVVIVGSDSPTLPLDYISRAFQALEQDEVVLGPARDGGYYLIGMKKLYPTLFEEIAWSTDRVLVQTTDKIRQLNLRFSLLDEWYDVDTPADLAFLVKQLRSQIHTHAPYLPRATIRTLSRFGLFEERFVYLLPDDSD